MTTRARMPPISPWSPPDVAEQIRQGNAGDRRRHAGVVPGLRAPGARCRPAGSPMASRSPMPAWTGSRTVQVLERAGRRSQRPAMRIAVVGVGLIGGSIALAARERLGATVSGFDPDPEALRGRLAAGDLDGAAEDLAGAVRGAEAVFVAAPVGALPEAVAAVLEAAGPDCVVSDVGSTKRAIVGRAMTRGLSAVTRWPGLRPLASLHARADLFDGATWYLTPWPPPRGCCTSGCIVCCAGWVPGRRRSNPRPTMRSWPPSPTCPMSWPTRWSARPTRRWPPSGERLPATGPSFRDATRVAGAPSAIWTDIYLSNADALMARSMARWPGWSRCGRPAGGRCRLDHGLE